MEAIGELLAHHPFFEGMTPAQIEQLAGCGKNAHHRAGEMIFREGEPANEFFLIRDGTVRIEIASPKLGPIAVQTVHAGEILGWSWLIPPYRWRFDACALEPVRVTVLDGKCLREKLDRDPALGFALMKRFAGILTQRLQATRLQLVESLEGAAEERAS